MFIHVERHFHFHGEPVADTKKYILKLVQQTVTKL